MKSIYPENLANVNNAYVGIKNSSVVMKDSAQMLRGVASLDTVAMPNWHDSLTQVSDVTLGVLKSSVVMTDSAQMLRGMASLDTVAMPNWHDSLTQVSGVTLGVLKSSVVMQDSTQMLSGLVSQDTVNLLGWQNGLTRAGSTYPGILVERSTWRGMPSGILDRGSSGETLPGWNPLIAEEEPDVIEVAEALELEGHLRRRRLERLVRHVHGAVDAAMSTSVDKWTLFSGPARLIVDHVLQVVAPQKNARVVSWVKANYPHEINDRGLPTPTGRIHFALRYHGGNGRSTFRVDRIADFHRDACAGLHRPSYEGGDLERLLPEFLGLMSWFLSMAANCSD